MPFERGTYLRRGDVATADNAVVARLREAGAIILGKTTTSEFGWTGVSHSPLTGITHNPWKHGLNAGASSAGAGVGAAAGYGPLHQGSDGAGSIRMPAHFCGVFGLKPTYGRVPQSPMAPSDYTLHLGPLTRTVADAALMLEVMAGPHPDDHIEPRRRRRPTIPAACEPAARAAHRLQPGPRPCPRRSRSGGAGGKAVEALRDRSRLARRTGRNAVGAEGSGTGALLLAGAFHAATPTASAEFRDRMDPGFVACIEAGRSITHVRLSEDAAGKMAYCAEIHHFFEDWDFLLTPAVSRRRVPCRAAAAEALAAASVGLDVLGGVLLSVQPVPESGCVGSLRLHRPKACRWACRSSAGASTILACCRCPRRSKPHVHGPPCVRR